MTSSEPALPQGQPPRVLAAGHLHPGMLFLQLLDGLRRSVVPALFGLITRSPVFLVAAGVYFLAAMVYALARYVTFEYRLTDEELVTTEGILHRQERRIPVNRIQDLSFESTLVRRICGLVVVSVETASAHGSEAKLDSLSRRDAEVLREALYQTRDGAVRGPAQQPVPETQLFHASSAELTLRGLTNNRIGVILAAAFGLYELAQELGLGDQVGGVFGRFASWASTIHWTMLVAVLFGVLFVALLGGWVVSVAAAFLMFYDFRLTVREDVFQRRYGLITTRAASLPRRKIQRVLLEQSFLRRVFGLVVLRADSAGSGMDPTEEQRGGRDVVVPLAEQPLILQLVPLLLPGLEATALTWYGVSSRIVVRVFLKGCTLCALVIGAGYPAFGWPVLAALVLLPLAWAVGTLAFHNLAYAESEGHFGLRWGILGRYRALLPLRKVQAVVVRRNPVDRMLGLARLTVYVAGGSPTTLSDLPRAEAFALQHRLATQAARRHFVW